MNSELEAYGYKPVYNYTQFAEDNQVNVIDDESHDRLNRDVMSTIATIVGKTFGPYGKNVLLSGGGYQMSTKDGWHTFDKIRFKNQYKELVLRQIYDIVYRMNKNVGDGTTSCLMLTEHLYRRLRSVIAAASPDDKRDIMQLLESIETNFHVEKRMDVTPKSLRNIINVAGNFDSKICDAIYEAYNPITNDDGKVSVADIHLVLEKGLTRSARVVQLPGKYRIPVIVNDGWGIEFPMCDPGCKYGDQSAECFVMISKTKVTNDCIGEIIKRYEAYDAANNGSAPPLVIVSRNIMEIIGTNHNNAYAEYCKRTNDHPKILPIYFNVENLTNSCVDTAAVMDQQSFTCMSADSIGDLDFNNMKTYDIMIYQGMSLGFMNVEPPESVISELEFKNKIDKNYEVEARIRDLKMESRETVLYVTYTSELDKSVVNDKIDDITHIVKSAINSGIVRNMMMDGAEQFYQTYKKGQSSVLSGAIYETIGAIYNAIIDVTVDLTLSKWPLTKPEQENAKKNGIDVHDFSSSIAYLKALSIHNCEVIDPPAVVYDKNVDHKSYNLITDTYVDIEDLCTSAAYDEEILKSSLATVRYLLDTGVMIFGVESFDTQNDLTGFTPK